ncbi:MAG TPA: hypothetical protein VGL65_00235 [Gemmatimonadales bacterium]|jgi:Tfp pilus assembly protein PilO
MKSEDIAIVATFAIAALLAGAMLMRPVLRAWAHRLEHQGGDADLMREHAELRERVAELEAGRDRMLELEERLDFAERMLAQRTEPARLSPDSAAP